jgi:DNA-binding response OmpR family regulator
LPRIPRNKVRGPILAGRSILIVEDEPLIALDMEIALRRVGAKVLSTAYLWVGLHFAEHPGLSAAVLDLRLGLDDCSNLSAAEQASRPIHVLQRIRGAAAYEL